MREANRAPGASGLGQAQASAASRRLATIPGIGVLTAASLAVLGDGKVFCSARHLAAGQDRGQPWLDQRLERRPHSVVAVALANKMARMAWVTLR